VSLRCAQKLARLWAIVAERVAWEQQLMQIKRMHQWVLAAEHLLSGGWVQAGDVLSNASVGERLDAWRQELAKQGTDGTLSELEQVCLTEFLQVLSNQRTHLVQCSDREGFPRTNNDMERSIRSLKTQYRRVSGRKNWNRYLLRYGSSVAYAAWWEQDAVHHQQLEGHVARLDRTRWRVFRRETKAAETRTAQTLSLPP
jgi:hypothetical protein